MKKSIILEGSILCLFILCSMYYQPIIADTPIENISIIKKSKASNLDINELKELYNELIELKSQSNEDCGCDKDNTEVTGWRFPVICTLLYPLWFLIVVITVIITPIANPPTPLFCNI